MTVAGSRTATDRLRQVVRGVVAVPMAPVLVLAALVTRFDGALSRRRVRRPRLVWGPVPIISIKYWSDSLRARGYEVFNPARLARVKSRTTITLDFRPQIQLSL